MSQVAPIHRGAEATLERWLPYRRIAWTDNPLFLEYNVANEARAIAWDDTTFGHSTTAIETNCHDASCCWGGA